MEKVEEKKEELKKENEKKTDEVSARTNDYMGRFKIWVKDPYNVLFLALIIFTIIIKLHYFTMLANQPTWWDEGDYLAVAKEIAIPSPETPEWWGHFVSIRPPLMPLIWAFFIKFGISEPINRLFTEVVPSILIVVFTYLFGKSVFNKKIGLIGAFSFSIYWVMQFYGFRFLTDIPTICLAMMSVYYFYEYYVKQKKAKGLYLGVLLGSLSTMARFPSALIVMGMIVYMILVKKHKILFDKETWIAALIGLSTLGLYLIFSKLATGHWLPALSYYLGSGATAIYSSFAYNLFPLFKGFMTMEYILPFSKYIPSILAPLPFYFAMVGLGYSIFRLVIGFDIFIKQKNESLNGDAFLLIWAILQVYFYVFWIKTGSDRYILLWMPLAFLYMGYGLELVGKLLNKYYKYIGLILTVFVLLQLSITYMPYADALIKQKMNSYQDVRDNGLWLKENTPVTAKIMCASIVQNVYYSQRRSYDFYTGTDRWVESYSEIDPNGRKIDKTWNIMHNETELECKMVRIKPDYLIIHIWEPGFTPKFMYDYPQRHPELLQPVKSWQRQMQQSDGTTQPMTTSVIFKFIDYPKINETLVNCTDVYARPENFTGLPLKVKAPERLIIPS